MTFAGCLVGSREIPVRSAPIAHVQVNESTDAMREQGRLPSSTRKFERNHAFCFGSSLARMSTPCPFDQRTRSASKVMSKYAASLLEPSSLGTVTSVISAPSKSRADCALVS